MSGDNSLRITAVVVLAGLLASSQDLRWAWQHSPYDQGAWIIALGYFLATGWVAWSRKTVPVTRLLLVGIAAGFIGFVGELNVARHLAVVLLVAAWMPSWPTRLLVAGMGLSWWPALGWVAAKFTGVNGAAGIRGLVLIVGLIGLHRGLKRLQTKATA